jgi:hypothetical protein
LDFLVILKNLLGGKSLSIAAPASYWYLKGFPIAQISEIVDYIVFMAYDLHGQVSTQRTLLIMSLLLTFVNSGIMARQALKKGAQQAIVYEVT